MKACAIVPSHNHYTALPAIVARLHTAGLPVFIIDDGSDEPARQAIMALHDADRSIIVHRLEPNLGKGAAVVTGFHLAIAAGFSHAVQIDADGQHDLEALPKLLITSRGCPTALISGQAIYDQSAPLGRRIGRWITHAWVWIETLSFQVKDSMTGFRVYPLAAVERLLRDESVGQRMDFDTDIMVRLFWRGTPVRMVPMAVVYPPGNPSNFRMLQDNLRITWMHTRLVTTMILRLPGIIAARPAPPSDSHWAGLRERGVYWGLRFCTTSYRLLGPRACRWVLAPIVLYFVLTGAEQRRASREFLGRALGRPPTFSEVFRHFMAFAERALDTFAAWIGHMPAHAVRANDPRRLQEAASDPRGALFVVAHLGNVDLARALLSDETRERLTLLVHTRNAALYNRVLAEFRPEAATRMIQVTEIGPETAIELKERVERGEWVVIAGDRTPVSGQGHVSRVAFLGDDAPFSHGPWILASLLECPVHLLFCMRHGDHHELTIEPFAERIILPRRDKATTLRDWASRYAGRLEYYARRDPFQWFNFYEYWAR